MGWAVDPFTSPGDGRCCIDGTCDVCKVKEAGARVLLAHGAFPYDDLEPLVQHHYRELAGQVMAAMSETMIATGLAAPREQ